MAKHIKKRLVEQLKAKGMDTGQAHAIATSQMKKSGNVKSDGKTLTAKGKKRSKMGAAGRAKDRAASYSGGKAKDYKYNARTNTATRREGRRTK